MGTKVKAKFVFLRHEKAYDGVYGGEFAGIGAEVGRDRGVEGASTEAFGR